MHVIRTAHTPDEIRRCHPVLVQLRPALGAEELVALVSRLAEHGYRLIYLEEAGEVRAVAGYRITEMLRTGRMLEVDDLVTAQDGRSKGYGKALLAWMSAEGRRTGCSVIELDSGTYRHEAHRFYFREGMHILGYHFSATL
jgi:GNAT superfamily N-acetyltransferase